MKKLLTEIIKSICDVSDHVQINESEDESSNLVFTVRVDPQDMGRIIGKEGKMINSIRNLMRVAARKQGKKIRIELEEPKELVQKSPPKEPSAKTKKRTTKNS